MGTAKKNIIAIIILAPFLIAQACFIYYDAKKRGEKHYFLWGLFGLLNIPSNLIIYLVVTRIIFKKKWTFLISLRLISEIKNKEIKVLNGL